MDFTALLQGLFNGPLQGNSGMSGGSPWANGPLQGIGGQDPNNPNFNIMTNGFMNPANPAMTPGGQQLQQGVMGGQGYNYLGASPYNGQWNQLIGQLQQQASGKGPSVAVQQYQAANQDALANQLAMSRAGRSPGAAMTAQNNMGKINQGLAQGSALARTQEMQGAQQNLMGALNAANNADYQRGLANQNAYLGMLSQYLQQPSQFDQSAGIFGHIMQGAAMMGG